MISRRQLIAGLFVGAAALSCTEAPMPERKPGLWEEIHVSNFNSNVPVKVMHCVGSGAEHALDHEMGDGYYGATCPPTTMTRKEGSLTLERRCKSDQHAIHGKATYKGDFDSSYEMSFFARYAPPLEGGLEEVTGSIKARWIGPCEPGQRPGDFSADTGVKVNLPELRKTPVTQ